MIYTASQIAQHFIYLAKKNKKSLGLVKLIKILYLSYGIYAHRYDKELFEDDIQAWKYGPVVPSVYHNFKRYDGYNQIDEAFGLKIEDKKISKFLKEIYEDFNQFETVQLVNFTHRKGSAWDKIFDPDYRFQEIPYDLIKEEFDKIYE